MTALYQSPFLLALGWAIAASLWQAALLWLVYQLAGNRNASPVFRHNLSLVLLAMASSWFAHTFLEKFSEFSAVPFTTVVAGDVADSAATGIAGLLQGQLLAMLHQFLPYFSAAYLIILLLLAIRWMKAYAYSRRLQTRGLIPIADVWIDRMEQYASRLGIARQVRIYLSEYIDVPATLNYFKPVILIPVAAFNGLSPEQMESVILHEMAHIKRKDYLINIAVSVIEILLFFNPFVHLLAVGLRRERENCCDDFVLQSRFDPHSYASALLSLEQMRNNNRIPAPLLAATGHHHQLLGRVKRIMNVKHHHLYYGQRLVALFLITFLLISLAWLVPEKTGHPAAVTDQTFSQQSEAKLSQQGDNLAPPSSPEPPPQPPIVMEVPPVQPKTPETEPIVAGEMIPPPVPPAPPLSEADLLENRKEGLKNTDVATEHNITWNVDGTNISLSEVWKTRLPEAGFSALKKLEQNLEFNSNDSLVLQFQNAASLWKALSEWTPEDGRPEAADIRKQASAVLRFLSLDTSFQRMAESYIQHTPRTRKPTRPALPKRDSLHIQNLKAPKKTKKSIWVKRFDAEASGTSNTVVFAWQSATEKTVVTTIGYEGSQPMVNERSSTPAITFTLH